MNTTSLRKIPTKESESSSSSSSLDQTKKTKLINHELAFEELRIAERPDVGFSGKTIGLKCNYLRIKALPKVDIYHYKFTVKPFVQKPKLLFKIFCHLCLINKFGNLHPIFDGRETIYSSSPLTFDQDINFKIVNFKPLQEYINKRRPLTKEVVRCNQILNVIINFSAQCKFDVNNVDEWCNRMAKNRILGGINKENMVINVDFNEPDLRIPAEPLVKVIARLLFVHRGNPKTRYKIHGIADIITEFQNVITDDVKEKLFMPIEVCEVLSGQRLEAIEDNSGIGIKLTTENQDRFQYISERVENVLQFDNAECRLLNPPKLLCEEEGKLTEVKTKGGRWTFENRVVQVPKQLENWSVISFDDERTNSRIQKFIKELIDTLNELGLGVVNKPPILVGNKHSIRMAMGIAFKKAAINKNLAPQLIVVIITNHSKPLYAEIKKVAEIELGIATQVITSDKMIFRYNKPLLANIGLKINTKIGGKNFQLADEDMGADNSHPSALCKIKKSICGVSGSMDSSLTTYVGRSSVQKVLFNPFVENLEEMIHDLLKNYYDRNQKLPQRILYYRSGLNNNQFRDVLNIECISLKAAFARSYQSVMPTLTYIIAEKSQHTRFLPENPEDADQFGHPRSGIVVDRGITIKQEFDFYLQSHPSSNAQSRPTHYHVLYDENNFNSEELQSITYKLCFLSSSCTHAISMPVCLSYASGVANRYRLICNAANRDNHPEAMDIDENDNESNNKKNKKFDDNNFQYILPIPNEKCQNMMYFV
ncbi:10673_t:CDS:10 [Diversispora eburnea]|uniref:10673_t:CDS:1 n=1 Tax=Diversispora eburnea TaxID=1213867 RepID=A0A9N8ZJP8_9GLOM|nr:10673_t:CDS:10 [Diversispora eburnea]